MGWESVTRLIGAEQQGKEAGEESLGADGYPATFPSGVQIVCEGPSGWVRSIGSDDGGLVSESFSRKVMALRRFGSDCGPRGGEFLADLSQVAGSLPVRDPTSGIDSN